MSHGHNKNTYTKGSQNTDENIWKLTSDHNQSVYKDYPFSTVNRLELYYDISSSHDTLVLKGRICHVKSDLDTAF